MNRIDLIFRLLGQKRIGDIEDQAHEAIDNLAREIYERAAKRGLNEVVTRTVLEIAREALHEAIDFIDKEDDH